MGKWLQSNEHLTFEVRERVARITLNRPHRGNAITFSHLAVTGSARTCSVEHCFPLRQLISRSRECERKWKS